jgi:hypothetical protein
MARARARRRGALLARSRKVRLDAVGAAALDRLLDTLQPERPSPVLVGRVLAAVSHGWSVRV